MNIKGNYNKFITKAETMKYEKGNSDAEKMEGS